MSDNLGESNGTTKNTIWLLSILLGLSLTGLGLLAGQVLAQHEILDKYVPRTEIEVQITGIHSTLNRIERKIDKAHP